MTYRTTATVRAVLEADTQQQLDRMQFWFASKMREACRNSNQGKIILGVYDDDDVLRSAVQFGGQVGDLEKMLDEAFELIELDQARPEAS